MLIQVYLTWMSVSFLATPESGTQPAQNGSLDASSTKGWSFSSTTSLQKTTSASGTSGKSWKQTLYFPIQIVQKMQIISNFFFISALSWNESHLLIHAGYTTSMSSSYEVMMRDGCTSKHSVGILNVIIGGYKLQNSNLYGWCMWSLCSADWQRRLLRQLFWLQSKGDKGENSYNFYNY